MFRRRSCAEGSPFTDRGLAIEAPAALELSGLVEPGFYYGLVGVVPKESECTTAMVFKPKF